MVDKFKEIIKQNAVEFVDFRFTDLLGKWHHITYRASAVTDDLIKDGITFDGSSIVGWKNIKTSDTLLMPDLETFNLDVFTNHKTLSLICDAIDPIDMKPYKRDPRAIAKRAEDYLKTSRIATNAFFGPEIEFFVFDDARFANKPEHSFFKLDGSEGSWNNEVEIASGNLGYRSGRKSGYMALPPVDSLHDLRSEILLAIESAGLEAVLHHHEIAENQCKIGFKYDSLTKCADKLQKLKYTIKNVIASYGKSVTFMPKPIKSENGSGMHIHQSLWNEKTNLFYSDNSYANLSELCLYYIGGIIKHAKAINAFTNPTTNSYKRLVRGYEAPINLSYSAYNRSAAIRIPYTAKANAKRIEVRFPDPALNPYLAFAAMMMAGIDGIKNNTDPGEHYDRNIYEMNKSGLASIPKVAYSLQDALDALEKDNEFLTAGGVFCKDMITAFIALKRQEVDEVDETPNPSEFKLYYNV